MIPDADKIYTGLFAIKRFTIVKLLIKWLLKHSNDVTIEKLGSKLNATRLSKQCLLVISFRVHTPTR